MRHIPLFLLPFFVTGAFAHLPCGVLIVASGLTATPVVPLPPIPVQHADSGRSARFAGVFAGAGLDAAAALRLADDLQTKLEDQLARLESNTSEPVMREVLTTLQSGAFLEGTGHRLDKNLPAAGGNAQVDGWVKSDEELADASAIMAARAQLTPGLIRPPIFLQRIGPAPRVPTLGDENDARVFVNQAILLIEEHGHLVQELRAFGSVNDSAACLSQWGRDSGVRHSVDHEADVYAWLLSKAPSRLSADFRGRYPSRATVPLR